jgi:hypothetical protein
MGDKKLTATEIEIALSKKHYEDFFITECKNGPTWFGGHLRMDAVAIKKSWANPCVTVYEVKVSRNDFLRDNKWPKYLEYCNRFFFACPKGLITKEDLPDSRVGLVYVNEDDNVRTVKSVPFRPADISSEFYRYILFSRLDNERLPFYSQKQDYIKAFIEHKKTAQSLAYDFKSELVKRAAEAEECAEKTTEELEKYKIDSEKLQKILTICRKNGLSNTWYFENFLEGLESALRERLQNKNAAGIIAQMRDIAKNIIVLTEENQQRLF